MKSTTKITAYLYPLYILLSVLLITPAGANSNNHNIYSPPSIILFIGDGMGAEHRKAAQWYSTGQAGTLNMDTLDYSGMSMTSSANKDITDSAAGATAIATGQKTGNGMVSMDPSLKSLTTILEIAKSKGMSSGLVTTTQISHATPAAFASHVKSRKMMTDIASQLLANKVDVLLGGGENEFLPTSNAGKYPKPGKRKDRRNLITEAISNGYVYVSNQEELVQIDINNTDKLLGLFADKGMRRPFSPSLALMADTAIKILKKNPRGFFLMIEGGQIDWAGHKNDALNNMQDTIDFDKAVAVGITYLNENRQSLLIVTADHETGDMSASLSSSMKDDEDGPFYMPDKTPFYINWSTSGHSSKNVPITSSGPQAKNLTGTFENTHIFDVMMQHIK